MSLKLAFMVIIIPLKTGNNGMHTINTTKLLQNKRQK